MWSFVLPARINKQRGAEPALPRDKLDNVDSAPLSSIPERLHGIRHDTAKAVMVTKSWCAPLRCAG